MSEEAKSTFTFPYSEWIVLYFVDCLYKIREIVELERKFIFHSLSHAGEPDVYDLSDLKFRSSAIVPNDFSIAGNRTLIEHLHTIAQIGAKYPLTLCSSI